MAGRTAVVEVDLRPERTVLVGPRPPHRTPTPRMLFNSLHLSSEGAMTIHEQP